MLLETTVALIQPLDPQLATLAQQHLDRLTKPPGSLGRLEELARRYVAITGQVSPRITGKAVVVFAADHGVTAEGISAYPQEVTAQMVQNFVRGGAAINALARHAGADVRVVDIGVATALPPLPGLILRKVRAGTANMTREPAMSLAEAQQCLDIGIAMADDCARDGVSLVATGDMGIGNTTASSALVALCTGAAVEQVTGYGTGIDRPTWERKIAVIEQAIQRHAPTANDTLGWLAAVGGLEIGGIAGLILGCARHRIPVLVDGLIATAGALIAAGLQPHVKEYMIATHASVEVGQQIAWQFLGQKPLLDLQLRLGEGTGAVLAMHLVEAALRIYNDMATFDAAGVSSGG
ncbi:MAG: nicotinate-nucleotide--dimethylbenzimidazole phosphoribosyltransferase [Candidatus Tectomicrobia bacterium]|uniref:Nicotinate-nucleotide--dimethylbenzimidazole phosphoribosyltransferase n=1 Tax=Tectimicrobiota bacterium TaxID=2528274 RepID=A0A938B065_UNCTE|nr:nicotinate-nucleotide--dimethylbenzimidazole phosphoribosyltransferase [Candidatus Tectomicrobia bacterium]